MGGEIISAVWAQSGRCMRAEKLEGQEVGGGASRTWPKKAADESNVEERRLANWLYTNLPGQAVYSAERWARLNEAFGLGCFHRRR